MRTRVQIFRDCSVLECTALYSRVQSYIYRIAGKFGGDFNLQNIAKFIANNRYHRYYIIYGVVYYPCTHVRKQLFRDSSVLECFTILVEGDFVSRTPHKRLISLGGQGQQHFYVSQHSIKILGVCPFSHAVQFFPCG